MMNQEKGRFEPISAEKVDAMQKDLDTLAAQVVPDRPVRTRVLPVLSENEEISIFVGAPLGVVPVNVRKIKPNGKLFVWTPHVEALGSLSVGLVVEIKGVKFRLSRTNVKGDAGLRMMTSIEVALWEQAGKPQPEPRVPFKDIGVTVTVIPNAMPVTPEIGVECVITNPSSNKKGFNVSTDAQLKRRDQQEKRRQGLAELRAKNRADQESAQHSWPKGSVSNKSLKSAEGARLAQERKTRKRLAPMLAAQEAARLRAQAEKSKKAEPAKAPEAVVVAVVAGVA